MSLQAPLSPPPPSLYYAKCRIQKITGKGALKPWVCGVVFPSVVIVVIVVVKELKNLNAPCK